MYVHRNMAYVPCGALLSLFLLSALYVDFFITSDQCGNPGRAAVGRFDPGYCRGSVGMGTDKGKPALSRRADPRSPPRHERKRLAAPDLLYVHTANRAAAA